jgi:uncharacterized protein
VFGVTLGWLFAAHVPDDVIRILVGITALAFIANVWMHGRPAKHDTSVLSGLFWGTLSGFASFASQGGGPPFQIYTLPQQMPKMVFVGTTTVFFAVVNVMKIVPYFMLAQFTAKNLTTSLVLLPVAVGANFAGIWMVKAVSTEHFYHLTYILLFVLGSLLCWQGTNHLLHIAA